MRSLLDEISQMKIKSDSNGFKEWREGKIELGLSHTKRTGCKSNPFSHELYVFLILLFLVFCRVFFQHLSRWTANSHLNLSD